MIGVDASFIAGDYAGGKEQVLFNVLKGIRDLGRLDEVIVFGSESAEKKFKVLSPEIHYVRVGMIDRLNHLLRRRMLSGIFFRTFQLPSMVKKYKLDSILFPVAYTGFASFNIKTVVIPHDIQFKSNPNIYKGYERYIFDFLYGFDFRKRSKIVAISEYDRDEITGYYPDCSEKIIKIYNPVIFDKMKSKDKMRPQEGGYIFANNLAYIHKNLITLLKAYDRIKDQVDYNLVIAGTIFEGNPRALDIMRELVGEGHLRLTGFLPKKEFDIWLEHAEMLVNPSSFEGFGLAAVEGMYACVPCLVADNSAVREVTLDRVEYYAPATDDKLLGDKMLQVLANPPDEAYLKESSELVQYEYGYLRIAEKYLTLLS